MRNALMFVLVLVPLMGACSKDSADAPAGAPTGAAAPGVPAGGSSEAATSVSGVQVSLPKIKAALASGTPGAADVECAASMANIGAFETAPEHQALAAELRQLCTKDVPLAKMTVAVAAAEAARKAAPDAAALPECASPAYASEKAHLTKIGAIDAASALVARFDAACPPAP